MMNTKTEGNTFTKKIGQTVYVVRYHFNEDAKETLQEKSIRGISPLLDSFKSLRKESKVVQTKKQY